MSISVTPKILHQDGIDHSVWEIVQKGRRKGETRPLYYQRVRYPGMRPIGRLDKGKLGNVEYDVYDVVKVPKGTIIKILTEADGHLAPMDWYEPITETKITTPIEQPTLPQSIKVDQGLIGAEFPVDGENDVDTM